MTENHPLLPGSYLNRINEFIDTSGDTHIGVHQTPNRLAQIALAVKKVSRFGGRAVVANELVLDHEAGLVVVQSHIAYDGGAKETLDMVLQTFASGRTDRSARDDAARIQAMSARLDDVLGALRVAPAEEDPLANSTAHALMRTVIASGLQVYPLTAQVVHDWPDSVQ